MEERRHVWRLQTWVLEMQGLNEVWEALGRVTEAENGNIECQCKGGTVREYADPDELAEKEANSRSEEVTGVKLKRWNFGEGIWAGVEFTHPSMPFPHSVHIFVHKKHSGAEADLNKIEEAVLTTRPRRWWWVEHVRLKLEILMLIWCLIALGAVAYILLGGSWVWATAVAYSWIVIEVLIRASRWILPAGTVAIGAGRVREENRKSIRWIIVGIVPLAALIISIM